MFFIICYYLCLSSLNVNIILKLSTFSSTFFSLFLLSFYLFPLILRPLIHHTLHWSSFMTCLPLTISKDSLFYLKIRAYELIGYIVPPAKITSLLWWAIAANSVDSIQNILIDAATCYCLLQLSAFVGDEFLIKTIVLYVCCYALVKIVRKSRKLFKIDTGNGLLGRKWQSFWSKFDRLIYVFILYTFI